MIEMMLSERRLKARVREFTGRSQGRSMQQIAQRLTCYLRGWKQYFSLAGGCVRRKRLDGWIRRRLRAVQLRQWRHCRTIYRNLRRLEATHEVARYPVRFVGRWWRAARAASAALPNRFFDELGIPRLAM